MITFATMSSTGVPRKTNAIDEQPGINVVAALTASGLLDDHRNQEILHEISAIPLADAS